MLYNFILNLETVLGVKFSIKAVAWQIPRIWSLKLKVLIYISIKLFDNFQKTRQLNLQLFVLPDSS